MHLGVYGFVFVSLTTSLLSYLSQYLSTIIYCSVDLALDAEVIKLRNKPMHGKLVENIVVND